jgi:glycosyltransferase involved in cell wall biosynthesis
MNQSASIIRTANLTGPVSRAAGGLYESVRRLVQELRLTGVEVTVLGTFDEFTRDDISAWDPVTVRAFKAMGPKQFGYSRGYREFLNLYRPHLLHTHGIWIYSSMATHAYAKKNRVPYMISPHGMLDPWAVRNSYWKKWIARHVYEDSHLRDCTCLRALCESEAQAFRTYGLKNPITTIPNGIDLPEERQGEELKAKIENGGKKTLLFLGRIHPKKGLPNLIRAFSQSLKSGGEGLAPWQLLIAGWDQGGHEAELIKLCEELGVSFERRVKGTERLDSEASVVFFGPAFGDDKKSLLGTSDAFILPSFSEGLPMSVLEAWSYKMPVVMTPECNLPEGFTADAAIRIETDAESIALGLNSLFSMSAPDLQAMGAKGRALVEERFTWKTIAAQMREVYDWMLGGGATPSSVVK